MGSESLFLTPPPKSVKFSDNLNKINNQSKIDYNKINEAFDSYEAKPVTTVSKTPHVRWDYYFFSVSSCINMIKIILQKIWKIFLSLTTN